MAGERMSFRVTALSALVPDGLSIEWMGQELQSGPLRIELQEGAGAAESRGELDYARRHARAEFHVQVHMPELADLLQSVGVDPRLTEPVHAVVRSEGKILDDDSFNLVGACRIEPHELLHGAQAYMLPGH